MATINEGGRKITPFIWFDSQAEAAALFYCSIFSNSRILNSNPMLVTFELEGQVLMALNGGPKYPLTHAFSLFVSCENQEEVDYYWQRLLENGAESQCGWLRDQYGLSWQIVPKVLGQLMGSANREAAKRVMDALLKMQKIDCAILQKAFEG